MKDRWTGSEIDRRTVDGAGVATTFLRWTFLRAVFHRGYVLVSSLYFVINAHLSASQLVILGTVMAVTLLVSDIPLGAWSDAFSRKWPLVIGHGFLAAGMAMTGFVTAFPLLLVTQVLWGLGWAFSTGADVAWVTDELDQTDRIARVLTARARWELIGGATGLVLFGLLGWTAGLSPAIVVAGAAMAVVGLFVAARFPEDNFAPAHINRWKASLAILKRGATIARRDHEILMVLAATMIINAASMVGWLFPKQLIDLGFPNNPLLWYTALGIVASAFGVVALHIVEARIHGIGVARRVYALSCLIGLAGLVLLAYAPNALIGGVGVVLASGIALRAGQYLLTGIFSGTNASGGNGNYQMGYGVNGIAAANAGGSSCVTGFTFNCAGGPFIATVTVGSQNLNFMYLANNAATGCFLMGAVVPIRIA